MLEAAFEGMDHLAAPTPNLSQQEAHAFAAKLPLREYTTDPVGLAKLARLATIHTLNPNLVNPKLPPDDKAPYFQAVYNHVEAFATCLSDLAEPAHVRPFEIHTFGPPACRPPIRASPVHAAFIRKEIQDLRDVGLVRLEATPWAAPCFAVPKPRTDKLQLVTEYRPLYS